MQLEEINERLQLLKEHLMYFFKNEEYASLQEYYALQDRVVFLMQYFQQKLDSKREILDNRYNDLVKLNEGKFCLIDKPYIFLDDVLK